MDRIKSIALTSLGIIVALAGLGFLACVGFVVIGSLVIFGALAALAASIAPNFLSPTSGSIKQGV